MATVSQAPVSIVTGSSRGIGFAIARQLADAGHRLVLVAHARERLDRAVGELGLPADRTLAVATDLRDPAAAETVVASTLQRFGEVSVLIDNAGTAPSDKVENTTDAVLSEALALHVRTPLALARACLPPLRQQRGCIVHMASTAGLRGFPFTSAYTAAKHAMVGLARAMAAELQPTGIGVYAVCPGFVDTDITRSAARAVAARGKTTFEEALQRLAAQNRIGRMHTVQEVAAAVVHLVRDRPAGCVYDLDRNPPAFVD
jgi:NAD(P)-dependent dehydrogenase (short-subunit alcohol dehydrogenase family)